MTTWTENTWLSIVFFSLWFLFFGSWKVLDFSHMEPHEVLLKVSSINLWAVGFQLDNARLKPFLLLLLLLLSLLLLLLLLVGYCCYWWVCLMGLLRLCFKQPCLFAGFWFLLYLLLWYFFPQYGKLDYQGYLVSFKISTHLTHVNTRWLLFVGRNN